MKTSTLINLGIFLAIQWIIQQYFDDLLLNKWIFCRYSCSCYKHCIKRFEGKIDGHGTQEYKQVSGICSPLNA